MATDPTGTVSGQQGAGVLGGLGLFGGYDQDAATRQFWSTFAQQPYALEELAALVGETPDSLQQGYQHYVTGEAGGDMFMRPKGTQGWVASQLQTLGGGFFPLIFAYEQNWEAVYKTQMPPELRSQLLQALSTATPAQQAEMASSMENFLRGYQQAMSQTDPALREQQLATALAAARKVPTLEDTLNNYIAVHPDPVNTEQSLKSQETAAFTSKYYNLTGHMPDSNTVGQYATADPTTQQSYFDNLPYNGGPGGHGPAMTFGAYTDAQSRILSYWRQAYGRDPTYQEVYNTRSWSPEDVKQWYSGLPSNKVGGMTNGTYDSLQQTGEQISTKLFGQPNSHELIQMFQDAQHS